MRQTRHRKGFIPLDNNIDKLIAFTPSLDKNWRDSQRIKSKPYQVETLDAIRQFQDNGWKISGANQTRRNNRQISSHLIKMEHPDLIIRNDKGQREAVSNILISNGCNGTKPLNLDIGAFRMVCSNGLYSMDSLSHAAIKHNEQNVQMLPEIIGKFNNKAEVVLNEFKKLKDVQLSPKQMSQLAFEAAELRFGDKIEFDVDQLLKVNRKGDEGDSLWSVYNRIQENLTQSNLLIDRDGNLISGVNNVEDDVKINQQLFELAYDLV
jgi:hypothetical protein